MDSYTPTRPATSVSTSSRRPVTFGLIPNESDTNPSLILESCESYDRVSTAPGNSPGESSLDSSGSQYEANSSYFVPVALSSSQYGHLPHPSLDYHRGESYLDERRSRLTNDSGGQPPGDPEEDEGYRSSTNANADQKSMKQLGSPVACIADSDEALLRNPKGQASTGHASLTRKVSQPQILFFAPVADPCD